MKAVIISFGILTICGCSQFKASDYLESQRQQLLQQGKAQAYADAYVDGCSTARRLKGDHRFNLQKRVTRFERESSYALGWQAGRDACSQDKARLPKTPVITPELLQQEKEALEIEAERRQIWEELKK
jgi:hypothetical protein